MTETTDTGVERTQLLADGNRIPVLGLGVWQIRNGPACIDAVAWALELGYRHIDTAQAYGNEESVGEGLRRSGVPREQVYITTKFHPARQDPTAEIEGSLERLGLDYVDLYLVHWPQGGATRAWPGIERAHQRGYARSIGVSNYGVAELQQVFARASIPPVVNQIEINPFTHPRAAIAEGRKRHVASEAYSPLGTGRFLDDRTVNRIASRIGRTPAQVLIRWCLQHDLIVLPKSARRERIEENAQVFDFALSDDDMAELDALD
jgi:2,5-diketo-D-gluconate reductase A